MIARIKVGNKTYYLDFKEIEQEKQFRKNKEIEFIRNARKFWNDLYNHNTNDMKPTEKQIKVIDTILSIIKTWKNSNDIQSPTHRCDIREFIHADLRTDDIISQRACEVFEDELEDLLYAIQLL